MFGKLVKYIWNPDAEEEEDGPVDSSHLQDHGAKITEKTFEGMVTEVHSDHGLIDHEVYFDTGNVQGNVVLKVGDRVSVTASRKHSQAGWVAVRVCLVPHSRGVGFDSEQGSLDDAGAVDGQFDGEIENGEVEEKQMIAEVTHVRADSGYLNQTIHFRVEDCAAEYKPEKGDWVICSVESNTNSGERQAVGIRPLREVSFEGKVNSVKTDHGYIDGDIYFTLVVCQDGYAPMSGDRVFGKAIESGGKRKHSWRALTVIHKTGNLANQHINASLIQSPMQTSALAALCADKEGVEVTAVVDFDRVNISDKCKAFDVWIKNGGTKIQTLVGVTVRCGRASQFSLLRGSSCYKQDCSIAIEPNRAIKYTLYCRPNNLGAEKQLVVFDLGSFRIGRQVTVYVLDPQQNCMMTGDQYVKQKGYSRYRAAIESPQNSWVVPGQKPRGIKATIRLPHRLGQFPVPQNLRDTVINGNDVTAVVPELCDTMSLSNYAARFKALLHLEEIQQDISIRDFDLERVCLHRYGEYLSLEVPGLSEGLPSVIVGDSVILSDVVMPQDSPEYQGYVHEVLKEEILLKFKQEFHDDYRGEDYNVRFVLNRITFRRAHQAVEFAPQLGMQVLFPDSFIPKPAQIRITSRKNGFAFINRSLNNRQKAAVVRILNGQCRPTPYLIFGPPGTGKTITVVEAVLQIFTQLKSSRILISAPSNSASDLLAERLHLSGRVQQADMARLNAYQRNEQSIAPSILPYCYTSDELELVSRHRLVVCTCSTAGKLYDLALKPGHFTHVFVDEAGQATEPECMIPVGLAAASEGQIVLAGDPMQLGPVLKSKLAVEFGLGRSLLERLIHRPVYERDEEKFSDHGSYDPLLVTKLVQNYRSHEAILSPSSTLFYHNELHVSGDKAMIECLCAWSELPNPNGFPVIFHGMRGEDRREGNNPSWFNPVEALQVMKYLKLIINNPVHALTMDDIGIITPYRKQVEKIRMLISKLDMDKVKVGSVEEFQGQERLVMIVSTVRSEETNVGLDVKNNIGFLSNPKRFNVAITRAQALLIVIGNPHVLDRDPMWHVLLTHCVRNNAYVGCDLPDTDLGLDVQPSAFVSKPEKLDSKNKRHSQSSSANLQANAFDSSRKDEEHENEYSQEKEDEQFGAIIPTLPSIRNGPVEISNVEQSSIAPPLAPEEGICTVDVSLIGSEDHGSDVWDVEETKPSAITGKERDKEEAEAGSVLLVTRKIHGNNGMETTECDNAMEEIGSSSQRNIVGSDLEKTSDGTEKSTWQSPDVICEASANNSVDMMDQNDEVTSVTSFGALTKTVAEESENVFEFRLCTENSFIYKNASICDKSSESCIVLRDIIRKKIENSPNILTQSFEYHKQKNDTCDVTVASAVENGDVIAAEKRGHSSNRESLGENKADNFCQSVDQSGPLSDELPLVSAQQSSGSSFSKDVRTKSGGRAGRSIAHLRRDLQERRNNGKHSQNSTETMDATRPSWGRAVWAKAAITQPTVAVNPQLASPSRLEKEIIKQMEYYFGDVNLARDKFLQDAIGKNPDGWVPLCVLVTFKKLQALSTDYDVICDALAKVSDAVIEVHRERDRVRRCPALPLPPSWDAWKHSLYQRSIALEGVPVAESRESLQDALECRYGSVEHVERAIPKTREGKARGLSQFDLVIFKSPQTCLNLPNAEHTALGSMSVKVYRSDSCVQQCVEYFYRKRVLGQRALQPVRVRADPRSIKQPCFRGPDGRDLCSEDWQSANWHGSSRRGFRHHVAQSESRGAHPRHHGESKSRDQSDAKSELQAKLLRCLDADGFIFAKPQRKQKSTREVDSDVTQGAAETFWRGGSPVQSKESDNYDKRDLDSHCAGNIGISASDGALTASEKDKLSCARRSLWLQAHLNASAAKVSQGPSSPRQESPPESEVETRSSDVKPSVKCGSLVASAGGSCELRTGDVTSPDVAGRPRPMTPPSVVAGGLVTSSPMRGVRQTTSVVKKHGVGRGIFSINTPIVTDNQTESESSPAGSTNNSAEEGTGETKKESRVSVLGSNSKLSNSKHSEDEVEAPNTEEPLVIQEGDTQITFMPSALLYCNKALDEKLLDSLIQKVKENEAYFEACAKASKDDEEASAIAVDSPAPDKENRDVIEDSKDGNPDPLITCDISPIVSSQDMADDGVFVSSGNIIDNLMSESSANSLTENAETYSSFINSTTYSNDNTTGQAPTLQSDSHRAQCGNCQDGDINDGGPENIGGSHCPEVVESQCLFMHHRENSGAECVVSQTLNHSAVISSVSSGSNEAHRHVEIRKTPSPVAEAICEESKYYCVELEQSDDDVIIEEEVDIVWSEDEKNTSTKSNDKIENWT